MIHVIATVTVAPGQRQVFLTEFKRIVPQVHAEQGCIEYGPAIDADTDLEVQYCLGKDTVTVVEKWDNIAALKAHMSAPHMLTYRDAVKDLVLNTELRILAPA